MNILLGTILLLIAGLMIVAQLRFSTRSGFILGFLVISYAIIIFITEVASLLHLVTAGFFLILHIVLLGIASLFWWKAHKPSLIGPFENGKWRIWHELPHFRQQPTLYILGGSVALVYALGAFLILTVPQNNYDSMTYHLSRVAYWIQHQTLEPWPTPNPRQTTFAINAEVGLLWTMLLSVSDRFTGFIQWFSAAGTALSIFGLARLLKATRSQAAFGALLWLTFPQILLQSTTTQNDLVAAFFFTSCLFFLFYSLKANQYTSLMLSGMAFGLAIGAKLTVLFLLPGLGLSLLITLALNGKKSFRPILTWGWVSFAGFLVLGLFNYVQNFIYYGDPFSIPEWTGYVLNPENSSSRLLQMLTNMIVYFGQMIDFSGIPEYISMPLISLKADGLKWLLLESGFPAEFSGSTAVSRMLTSVPYAQEDVTWFGPVAFLCLLPTTVNQFLKGLREKDFIRISLILMAVVFFIMVSFLLSWTPFRGRYFVLIISVLSPLLAFAFRSISVRNIWVTAISALALFVLVWTTIFNVSKPLVGQNAIWGKNSVDLRMANNPEMQPVLELVNEFVPIDGSLATRLGGDHWDYTLFGEKLSREIIQLDPAINDIDTNDLREIDAQFLLSSPREQPFLEIPAGLIILGVHNGWYLFKLSSDGAADSQTGIKEQLLGLQDKKSLLSIDPTLQGIVGVTELYTVDWGIEVVQGKALLWLGEGLNQGLSGFLRAEDDIPVRIIFEIEPGPSRAGSIRNMAFNYFKHGPYGAIREDMLQKEITIEGPEKFEIILSLQKGLNEFRIRNLDLADIPNLPNDDPRALLTRVNSIEVVPLEDEPSLTKINQNIDSNIQVYDQQLAPWGLEYWEDQAFMWLGEGLGQGYKALIWSDQEQSVSFTLNLLPGPSREDSIRHLQFSLSPYGYSKDKVIQDQVIQISSQEIVSIQAILNKGFNVLQVYSLDEATVAVLPGSDKRPLLVQLRSIKIDINE